MSREMLVGMDSFCLEKWLEDFLNFFANTAVDGKNFLLIYDCYGNHMGLNVLRQLKKGGVLAHCFSSRTSGLPQPLDVTIFGPLKSNLSALLDGLKSVLSFPLSMCST